jgi:glucokinase
MYVGIDVGGTKTLIAVLDDHGNIREETKIPTPKNYGNFLLELRHALAHMEHRDFRAGGIAIPGRIDRHHGKFFHLGHLGWHNQSVQADCEQIFDCPFVVENDANLAALSEAMLQPDYENVLYVTISTGIGTGLVHRQQLDEGMLDMEGGQIKLAYRGRLASWESFASGHAIYEHFGKKASDIPATDEQAWRYVARNLALGLFENIAITQPDLIVFGGSVGVYFEHYAKFLRQELKRYEIPLLKIPKLIEAERPEQAVIYGCYDLAKQKYGHAALTR